ncbi:MAG: DUF3108 domain-containing protein [Bacteroidales bacterium]|nr:DUF3108 domain-containing protein [Bacteroidales bacterium]
MNWYLKLICLFLFGVQFISVCDAQECKARNYTFREGEELIYIVSYNWFIIWTDVGEVTFTVKSSEYKDNPAYHYMGVGKTFKSWDWIFSVYDKYQCYVNPLTLKPYYFKREVKEGNFRQLVTYEYNFDNNTAVSDFKVNDNPLRQDTVPISSCTFDVMSGMLFSRNIDFTSYEVGDTIPITIILDQKLYHIYFRYLGIEDRKIKHVGKFECIKFSIMLVEGTVFNEGEDMMVWVTNDKNRMPIYAESPILVGSVKVRIADVKGNRYPFTSLRK